MDNKDEWLKFIEGIKDRKHIGKSQIDSTSTFDFTKTANIKVIKITQDEKAVDKAIENDYIAIYEPSEYLNCWVLVRGYSEMERPC